MEGILYFLSFIHMNKKNSKVIQHIFIRALHDLVHIHTTQNIY